MALYRQELIDVFKTSKNSTTADSVTLTGIALGNSENGEVIIQLGDPIEELLDEENDGFVETFLDDELDDSIDNAYEDELEEEYGEDDEYDEEDLEETEIVYIGDDEEAEGSEEYPEDNTDEEGNIIEEVE